MSVEDFSKLHFLSHLLNEASEPAFEKCAFSKVVEAAPNLVEFTLELKGSLFHSFLSSGIEIQEEDSLNQPCYEKKSIVLSKKHLC